MYDDSNKYSDNGENSITGISYIGFDVVNQIGEGSSASDYRMGSNQMEKYADLWPEEMISCDGCKVDIIEGGWYPGPADWNKVMKTSEELEKMYKEGGRIPVWDNIYSNNSTDKDIFCSPRVAYVKG